MTKGKLAILIWILLMLPMMARAAIDDSLMCVVKGELYNPDGTAYADQSNVAEAKIADLPEFWRDIMLTTTTIYADTDSLGILYLKLPRGAQIHLTVDILDYDADVTIPDLDTVIIKDLGQYDTTTTVLTINAKNAETADYATLAGTALYASGLMDTVAQSMILEFDVPSSYDATIDTVYVQGDFNRTGKYPYIRVGAESGVGGMQGYGTQYHGSLPNGCTDLDSIKVYYRTSSTVTNSQIDAIVEVNGVADTIENLSSDGSWTSETINWSGAGIGGYEYWFEFRLQAKDGYYSDIGKVILYMKGLWASQAVPVP